MGSTTREKVKNRGQKAKGQKEFELEDDYVAEKENFELPPTCSNCGNYKHECPRFEAAKLALMTARVYCPFCGILNDGRCSHFDYADGHHSLKVCNRCCKYGEHRSSECPNVVDKRPGSPLKICRRCCKSGEHWTSQCPNVVLRSDNCKRPGPELESKGKASKLPRLGTDAQT